MRKILLKLKKEFLENSDPKIIDNIEKNYKNIEKQLKDLSKLKLSDAYDKKRTELKTKVKNEIKKIKNWIEDQKTLNELDSLNI